MSMTVHRVEVYSMKPFCASIPSALMACEGKLTVEAARKAVERGKCAKGHAVLAVVKGATA